MVSPLPNLRQLTVQALRQSIRRRFTGGGADFQTADAFSSTGIAALDAWLPERGFPPGTVGEWVSSSHAGGTTSLLVRTLTTVMSRRPSSQVALFVRRGQFHAEMLALAGVDLSRVIVIRPRDRSEWLWSLEQVLRCRGVVATVSERPRCSSVEARRLKVATERGGGLGLFFRHANRGLTEPGVDVRFKVTPVAHSDRDNLRSEIGNPAPILRMFPRERNVPRTDPTEVPYSVGRRLRVELLTCRGAATGASVLLEICDETGAVREASRLAPATETLGTSSGKRLASRVPETVGYGRAG